VANIEMATFEGSKCTTFEGVSNALKVSRQNTVFTLRSLGHSIRQLARQTDLNRRTVRRYFGASDACVAGSKYTISTPKWPPGRQGLSSNLLILFCILGVFKWAKIRSLGKLSKTLGSLV
jgi:hypothetical protein